MQVRAPADRVWQILVDFQTYGEWNPFIYKITGEAVEGEKLRIWLRTPSGRERTYEPTVLTVESGRELRWLGKSFFLDGEHIFSVESSGPEVSRFVQREIFRGPLTRFLGSRIDEDISGGFEQMNQALKRRAESSRA